MKKLLLLLVVTYIHYNAKSQSTDAAKKASDFAASSLKNKKNDLKDGWTSGGTFNLNINEAGQNHDWTFVKKGEEMSLGARVIIDYSFDRKKSKKNWLNLVRARFGVQKTSSSGKQFLKNDDFIAFSSTYGEEFSKSWSYAGFFSLETRFEGFFSPGYIKLGPGILYKPNTHFNLLVTPLISNITTKFAPSLKSVKKFDVDSGRSVAWSLGAFAQANINYNVAKGVNYKSVGTIYSNYLQKPGNIIFDWNNLFTLTVNKLIGATVIINTRYNDFEIGGMQLQHSIGVGLSYKL
ncbi:MAG: DUF3078 domain-containing protein [Ferruginibacter sp.]|nr:DUF3078 domain-containing protein [Ferruginibacter sp.]